MVFRVCDSGLRDQVEVDGVLDFMVYSLFSIVYLLLFLGDRLFFII